MQIVNQNIKVWVGFITYGESTAQYLPYFLQSLERQTYQNVSIVCFDNSEEVRNENSGILEAHPHVKVYRDTSNIGFSRAYNILMSEAKTAGARYFFVVNPDTVLEPDVIDRLVSSLDANPFCASVSPKLRRWNFLARTKTTIIDSCGLILKDGLQFFDLGPGEEDRGQYDNSLIMGVSGAAGLFRLSALEHIAEQGKYYDEYFFMYKEDCDLAYRLQLAGYSSLLVPKAIMYHDRTVSGGNIWQRFFNRRQRFKVTNRYAFVNQHLLYIKYWSRQTIISKLKIIVWVVIRFFEALLLEQYLLESYIFIFKGSKLIKKY